jgi:hypothetical protein
MKKFSVKLNDELLPTVFVHIQKTAGSSIIRLVRKHFGKSVISHGDYYGHRPEEFQDVAFVSGHFGYDYAKSFMDSRYSFTFLRNPAERILSFYYYNRARDIDEFPMTRIAHQLDLEQFLKAGLVDPLVKSRIWNNQTWQLAQGYSYNDEYDINNFSSGELLDLAISHLSDFSYIGFTEFFEDDLNMILPNLDIPIPKKTDHVNVTRSRLCSTDIPSTALDILEELTELDQILYKKAQYFREKTYIQTKNSL